PLAVIKQDMSELGLADAQGVREHRLEDRFHVPWRRADDLEHLRCRGLLLQRFRKIVRARAQFVEQSRVLDRNDRLRGKIADQLDLFVGKFAYFLAKDKDATDELVVFQHRDRKNRP